jgi:hypothetical protein
MAKIVERSTTGFKLVESQVAVFRAMEKGFNLLLRHIRLSCRGTLTSLENGEDSSESLERERETSSSAHRVTRAIPLSMNILSHRIM